MTAISSHLRHSLVFRVVAPVVVTGLVVGAGMYLVLKNAVERFGNAHIADQVVGAAQDLYAICEENYETLIKSGTLGDERHLRIAQGRTLGEVEEFMRQARLSGSVRVHGTPRVLAQVDLAGVLPEMEARVSTENQVSFVVIKGEPYGAQAFSFEPWNWQIIVFQDLEAFAGLNRNIRNLHLTVGASLVLGVLLLAFLLGRFVREPLSAIIEPIRSGRAPDYSGIREFAFLSDTIRRMMESEREKTVALANAQRIAHLGNWDWDIGQRTLAWSEELCRIFGVEALPYQEMVRTFWASVHPDDLPGFRSAFREALKEGTPLNSQLRVRRPDGQIRWLNARAEIDTDGRGRSTRMVGTAYDVTELKQVEQALRETERRFRALAENSQAGIWQLDRNGHTVYANPAMCTMLGVSHARELQGRTYQGFFPPDSLRRIAEEHQKRDRGESSNYRIEIVRSDGTRRHAMVSGSPLMDGGDKALQGTIGTFIDVTEATEAEFAKQALEQQMQQTQRLESLGVLAGGIAHDFNNTLTPMIGYAEMVIEELPEGSPLRQDLAHVLVGAERAGQLVKQILAFSRGIHEELYLLQVEPIAKESLSLMRASLPATIDVQFENQAGALQVEANPSHVHQIITNLCTNAGFAMEPDGGVLTVRLEQVAVGSEGKQTERLVPGDYLRLSVTDTGAGIPEAVRERIFEPFFTTKGVGQGTGMGLSVVHGIVTRLGGCIALRSRAGEGSTFEVYLPVASERTLPAPVKVLGTPAAGSEHVLVVDDEALVVDIWSRSLSRHGYKVFSTTSSQEALDVFEADPQRFDLVITDQTMPVLTGDKVAERMLRRRPDLPIILCTGFSKTVGPDRARELGIRGFLMKPCSTDEMLDAVRSVLDGALFGLPKEQGHGAPELPRGQAQTS